MKAIIMKKIYLLILILLILIIQNIGIPPLYQLEKPVKNYQITAIDYPKYIDCEQLMNDVSSAKVSYAQVQDYMTKQVYNALSGKTKSWYTENGEIYNTEIKVINEQLDTKNPQSVYIELLYFFQSPTENKGGIWYAKVSAVKNENTWKLLKYTEAVSMPPLDKLNVTVTEN